MRKRKLLAVLLSTVLLTQAAVYAAAEPGHSGNAGNTAVETQEALQESVEEQEELQETGETQETITQTHDEADETKAGADQASDLEVKNPEADEAESEAEVQKNQADGDDGAAAAVSTGEPESSEAEPQEEAESPNGLTGGYLHSDLDYNTPVYHGSSRARSAVPSAYQSDINALRSTYPAVRDQNPYGTCWAFSTMGLAEFDLINKRAFDRSADLSELQLAYFTYNFVQDPLGGTVGDSAKYYNENTDINYLNYGGNYAMAVRRLGQWIGAVREADVPYSQAAGTVTNGLDDSYAYQYDAAHLENAYLINLKENAADVKRQIMKHGAVGTMYDHLKAGATYAGLSYSSADPAPYNAYYRTQNTNITSGDGSHAVMIVGWDDNFSKDNFRRGEKPGSDGAWLIRNSWGDGSYNFDYFWMSYETYSLADTAWVMDFSTDDGYDNNYQLDGGVQTYLYSGEGSTTVANIFDVSEKSSVKSEMLEAVSLSFTHMADVEYTIDIYTDIPEKYSYSYKPVSGTKQEAATTHGTTTYAGVYTIPLAQPVELKPGSRFSVVVTMDKAAMDCESAVNIQSQDDWGTNKYIWECSVSYYDYQYDYRSYYVRTDGYGYAPNPNNYCIKAFTSNQNYEISYELNGGTNAPENPEICGTDVIQLKNPVKEGCVFEGWYLDSDYQTQITEIPAEASSDYTLYAKWSSVTGEKLVGYSLSMKGNIEVNYYVDLPQELLTDETAVFEISLPNGTTESIAVNAAEKTSSGYKVSCPVAAKEMTDSVEMRVVTDDQAGEIYTYSVKGYAEYVLEHQDQAAYSAETIAAVKSMLNYGASAQEFFGYHVDRLANEGLSEEDKTIEGDINFEPYRYSLETNASVTGIAYYGSSLLLRSETAVRNYFELEDGHDLSEYQFAVAVGSGEAQPVQPKAIRLGGQNCCYVEIDQINAKDLDQDLTVTIRKKDQSDAGGITLKYGVFSYADAVAQMTNPDEKLVQVTRALYRYWEKAKAYADAK